MRATRNAGLCLLFMLGIDALGASAVSKFWNEEFAKNYGCGPGNYVASDDSWLSTYIASSINLTSTPLIPLSTTSGVSGCDGGPPFVEITAAYRYFASNLHRIMRDAANGGGESLNALSKMWGLSKDQNQALGQYSRNNFNKIFGEGQQSPEVIYHNLYAFISNG